MMPVVSGRRKVWIPVDNLQVSRTQFNSKDATNISKGYVTESPAYFVHHVPGIAIHQDKSMKNQSIFEQFTSGFPNNTTTL